MDSKTLTSVLIGLGILIGSFAVDFGAGREQAHAGSGAVAAVSLLPREDGIVPASFLPKSDREWKKVLTPEQYKVLRMKGTERAFTGKLHAHKAAGVYRCAACGQPLFHSDTKYDSGTGWPSFYQPLLASSVATADDSSFFSMRTEVLCARCGGHLGHVFDDGPEPTGLRYCMNSAALSFDPAAQPKTSAKPAR